MNWLVAWLGQNGGVSENAESVPEQPDTTAVTQSKVQWLTLLPSVPAYEALLAGESTPETPVGQVADQPVSVEILSTVTPDDKVDPVELLGPKDSKKEKGNSSSGDAKGSEDLAAPASVPVAVVAESAKPLVAAPDVAAIPVAQIEPPPVPRQTSDSIAIPVPASKTSSVPSSAPSIPPPPELNPMPIGRPPDKGEVIWSADLFVQEQPTSKETPLPVVPTAEVPSPTSRQAKSEPEPAPKLAVSPIKEQSKDASTGQGSDEPPPDSSPDRPQVQRLVSESPSEHPEARTKVPGPTRKESAPPANSRQEGAPAEGAPRHSFPTEFAVRTSASPEPSQSPPVEAISVEPATAIRPSQIASVQVDLPAPAGSEDSSPMRLVVTQRGDQVNVRLRSWDSGTAPIESNQMQPLLSSLAEKGYVSELKPLDRIEEQLSPTAEVAHAKQMTTGEAASSNNDQQSFQGANERQQQNQERQQQQQAQFLRKQLRTAQTEEFNFQTMLDANDGGQQKGAYR